MVKINFILYWLCIQVDLVPTWVTKKWVKLLSGDHPTLAFHASITNSFGKGALINLLRQIYVCFLGRNGRDSCAVVKNRALSVGVLWGNVFGTLIVFLFLHGSCFAKLHPDKKQISVGVVGYPNVGKSSIINTLKKKKV
ncbi:unnamed protein product, partial [Choristocarpus tenellus]